MDFRLTGIFPINITGVPIRASTKSTSKVGEICVQSAAAARVIPTPPHGIMNIAMSMFTGTVMTTIMLTITISAEAPLVYLSRDMIRNG